ncbi:ArnT family glycosyltransferase [Patescibacteria group bacterium]
MVKDILKSIKKLKNYKYILFIIIILSFFLRFWDLGYSNFYGDETKTFYTDKTVSATKFFMSQRKGPVQYGVVWGMEKIVGGYDEFYTRIPFALAGSLSVLVFYLIVQKISGRRAALLSTALFGLNGFFVAFSRTIQYQSFLILFGLLSVYFVLLYQECEDDFRKAYSVISAVFIGLAYLSHYDAIFFDIAVSFILIKVFFDKKDKAWEILKEIAIYYVLPAFLVAGAFYIPYVLGGHYADNTASYVNRRLEGLNFNTNSSWYTFWIYNPHSIWAFLSVFAIPFFLKRSDWDRNLLVFWFLIPFVVFQFVFTNPGTHIHNYFIPLMMIIGIGASDFMDFINEKSNKQHFYAALLFLLGLLFVVDLFVFIPSVNKGFPWKASRRYLSYVPKVNKKYHLFLYGFPYERGWEQIAEYVEENNEIRKIYTNDNDTIAQYYLKDIDYTVPGVNYLPEYFIYVFDNQDQVVLPEDMLIELDDKTFDGVYDAQKAFFVEGELTAVLYKLNRPNIHYLD